MPLQPILIAEASRRIDRVGQDADSGAGKLANYFVGQIVGTMNEVKPAAQVVFEWSRSSSRRCSTSSR